MNKTASHLLNDAEIDVHVGTKMRTRRQERGISQSTLGEALGVSFQQVQKYERGANRVSAPMLVHAAACLSVPVAWFFEGLPQPEAPTESADQRRARLWAAGEGSALIPILAGLDPDSIEILWSLATRLRELQLAVPAARKAAA